MMRGLPRLMIEHTAPSESIARNRYEIPTTSRSRQIWYI